jgi:hypothetical protein
MADLRAERRNASAVPDTFAPEGHDLRARLSAAAERVPIIGVGRVRHHDGHAVTERRWVPR